MSLMQGQLQQFEVIKTYRKSAIESQNLAAETTAECGVKKAETRTGQADERLVN